MNVLVENNGAWYTIVVTPNKLFGAFIPTVELNFVLDISNTILKINSYKVENCIC